MPSVGHITPAFLSLLERSSREPVAFTLGSKALAVKLRQKFNSFRARLRREAANSPHLAPYAELTEHVETALREIDGSFTLIFRPTDWEIHELLAEFDNLPGEVPGDEK